MTRVLVLATLWLLQAALVVLLINADWVSSQTLLERQRIGSQFGDERYAKLATRATDLFETWFISSGFREETYARLLPDRSRPREGMDNLAPWFFEWLKRRLDAFWLLMLQAMYRFVLLREWAVVIALTAIVAAIDGLVQRQITRACHGLANADRYLAARRTFILLAFAPFLYLTIPIAVTPTVVPIWGALAALVLMQLTAHAQHRL